MQNGHRASRHLRRSLKSPLSEPQRVCANIWRVDTIVTAVQRQSQLAEDAPDKRLGRPLPLVLEVPDDSPKISIPTIFHVQVQVLTRLEVFPVVVLDDVVVSKVREDLELGVELLALLLGHTMVRDLLTAHHEAIVLAAHFANDSERPMPYRETSSVCMSQRSCSSTSSWVWRERTDLFE